VKTFLRFALLVFLQMNIFWLLRAEGILTGKFPAWACELFAYFLYPALIAFLWTESERSNRGESVGGE